MKIGLCQLNTVMGDIAGNTVKVREALESVKNDRPDLLVFSELFCRAISRATFWNNPGS